MSPQQRLGAGDTTQSFGDKQHILTFLLLAFDLKTTLQLRRSHTCLDCLDRCILYCLFT